MKSKDSDQNSYFLEDGKDSVEAFYQYFSVLKLGKRSDIVKLTELKNNQLLIPPPEKPFV